jgi:hypothetical protein
VSAGDGFLGYPLEHLNEDPVRSAHHDGRAFGDKSFGTEWWQVVSNQQTGQLL